MNIYIDRIQRGVGQGGFHTCSITAEIHTHLLLRTERHPFEFVFDCGTRSLGPKKKPLADFLNDHIQAYEPADGIVDALFISHLDVDHYNGAEQLCNSKDVSRVFLPYFTVDELLLMVISEITADDASTAITTTYINTLIGIARGNRLLFDVPVTVIGGPNTQDNDQRPIQQDSDRLIVVEILDDGTERAIGGHIASGSTIGIKTKSRRLPWILRPWSYQQSKEAQKAITAAIDAIPALKKLNRSNKKDRKPGNVSAADIKAIHENKIAIRAACSQVLTDAGGTPASDHNAVSLCLYSGPQPRLLTSYRAKYIYRGSEEPLLRHDPTGWISTGDSLLSKHWKDFCSAFADVLGNVGTYVVPHHGSDLNHSPELLHSVAGRLAVICARSHSKDHPGTTVLDDLYEVDSIVKRVDEYSTYGLREIVLFEVGNLLLMDPS